MGEAASHNDALNLASFPARSASFFIDFGVYLALYVLLFAIASRAPLDGFGQGVLFSLSFPGYGALQWLYGSVGSSPGKHLLGLRIVCADGSSPGWSRGLRRAVGSLLSTLPAGALWLYIALVNPVPLGLGYAWAALDRRKQTWHDRLAGTYVVRQPETAVSDAEIPRTRAP